MCFAVMHQSRLCGLVVLTTTLLLYCAYVNSSPLLEAPIDKAKGIVFNIVGGKDMTLQVSYSTHFTRHRK
jgi:FtsZ family, C-terminal domain